ncbi:hypothetical protein EBB07_08600 [Paenibacillaceae bacterium]|nr:hypothetical protein EBB07_08600 [Paenibacillaceae bacterium]
MNKWFLAALLVVVIAGCSARMNEITETDPELPQEQAGEQADDETKIDDETEIEEIVKSRLFEKNLLTYDEFETVTLTWGGEKVQSSFHMHPDITLFGLYLPEFVKEYDNEDGRGWGYGTGTNDSYINILYDDESLVAQLTMSNDALVQYEEYIGSRIVDGATEDYFKFFRRPSYLARITYYEENKEDALPLFLEAARNIRFVEDEQTKEVNWYLNDPKRTEAAMENPTYLDESQYTGDEQLFVKLINLHAKYINERDEKRYFGMLTRENNFNEELPEYTIIHLKKPDFGQMSDTQALIWVTKTTVKNMLDVNVSTPFYLFVKEDGEWKLQDID